MLRRKALDASGLFDESFTHSEDYDLWLRIGRSHSIGYVGRPLIQCRRHSANTSLDMASHRHFEQLALQKVDAQDAWQAFTRLYPAPQNCYQAWIWFLLRSGNPGFAEEADRALARHPKSDSLRFAIAVFQYDCGQYDMARSSFQAMSQADAACLNNIGVLAALCGDSESAVSHFHAALQLCPQYRDARANLIAATAGGEFTLTRRPFRQSLVPLIDGFIRGAAPRPDRPASQAGRR
jgi:tetratricopeptide (TPR) repeat protein